MVVSTFQPNGTAGRPISRGVHITGYLAAVIGLVVLTWLALRVPLAAVGLLYVGCFLIVAWTKPPIALMLAFASAPLQNDVSGGGAAKFSLAEVNLALTLICFVLQNVVRKERITLGPIQVPVFLYLAICFVSSLHHWRGKDAVVSMLQMIVYLIVAVLLFSTYATSPRDLLPALHGLIIIGVVFSILGLATHSTYLLGIHKNGIGGSMFAAFTVALELWLASDDRRRKRLLGLGLLVITAGLINTLSRGAWLAALVGLVLIFLLRREWRVLSNLTLLLIPTIVLAWMIVPPEQKSYATDIEVRNTGSVGARLKNAEIATSYIKENPWLGEGIGLRKQHDATNVFLFTLAESGVLGLLAFVGIHIAFLWMIWRTHSSLDPKDPAFSCLAIGGALVLGKLAHGQLDHYWSRGTVMMAWSSAGMATYAFHLVNSRRLGVRS